MAAPAFVQAGAGAIWQSGGAVGATLSGVTVGNFIIGHCLADGGLTTGSPTEGVHSGLELLNGTDGGLSALSLNPNQVGATQLAQQFVYLGRAISTSCTWSLSNPGNGEDLYFRLYEFSDVNTGSNESDVLESLGEAQDTGTTISDVGVTTTGADRLAMQFIGVADDNALAAFSGETGGDWTEPVGEFLSATGTDGCIGIQTATMASAGTINGGTLTMAASDGWGVIGFALIGTTSATPASLPNVAFDRRTPRRRVIFR